MMKNYLLLLCLLLAVMHSGAQPLRLVKVSDSAFLNGAYMELGKTQYHYSGLSTRMDPASEGPDGIWYIDTTRWAADSIIRSAYDLDSAYFHDHFGYLFEYDNAERVTRAYVLNAFSGPRDTLWRIDYGYTNGLMDSATYTYIELGYETPMRKMYYTHGQYGLVSTIQRDYDMNLSSYENTHENTIVYNTSGQPVEYIHAPWDGSAFVPYSRQVLHYTGNNVDTITHGYYSGGWIWTSRGVYTYDGNNDNILIEVQGLFNNAWENAETIENQFDNDHNKTSEMFSSYVNSVWTYTHLVLYEYNTANLLTLKTPLLWDASSGTFIPSDEVSWKRRYFYETPTSVSGGTVKQSSGLRIFPNPAGNSINISSMSAQSKPFSITIFDATGKSVKHWNEAPTTCYQKQVDVSQLPSGNYFLRVDNSPQEAVQFTILR